MLTPAAYEDRQSLLGRPWLYGEGIVGYSWPRLDPED